MAYSIKKKIILLAMPLFQIVSTGFVFRLTSMRLGQDWAIIIGFLFSQIIWCLLFPLLLLGRKDFIGLFRERESLFKKKNIIFIILLSLTVIGAIAIYLVPNIKTYSVIIFLLGIPFAVINSTCEEILWRGAFIKIFENKIFFSIIYPVIFFTLYHIPFQLYNLEVKIIETLPFALMTLPLGLIYSIVAYRNKSIKWVIVAHSLSGIIAFGIPSSTSLANILNIT
jgi:membrane protease YdiL (CAAX protease family)